MLYVEGDMKKIAIFIQCHPLSRKQYKIRPQLGLQWNARVWRYRNLFITITITNTNVYDLFNGVNSNELFDSKILNDTERRAASLR